MLVLVGPNGYLDIKKFRRGGGILLADTSLTPICNQTPAKIRENTRKTRAEDGGETGKEKAGNH